MTGVLTMAAAVQGSLGKSAPHRWSQAGVRPPWKSEYDLNILASWSLIPLTP